MRIVQRFAMAVLVAASSFQSACAQKSVSAPLPQPDEQARKGPTTKEVSTDAAIVVLIIAASVSAYKSSGRPCACPYDFMRNGRECGGKSAWSRPGGAKPICYPGDVTLGMIEDYRRRNVLPARLN